MREAKRDDGSQRIVPSYQCAHHRLLLRHGKSCEDGTQSIRAGMFLEIRETSRKERGRLGHTREPLRLVSAISPGVLVALWKSSDLSGNTGNALGVLRSLWKHWKCSESSMTFLERLVPLWKCCSYLEVLLSSWKCFAVHGITGNLLEGLLSSLLFLAYMRRRKESRHAYLYVDRVLHAPACQSQDLAQVACRRRDMPADVAGRY